MVAILALSWQWWSQGHHCPCPGVGVGLPSWTLRVVMVINAWWWSEPHGGGGCAVEADGGGRHSRWWWANQGVVVVACIICGGHHRQVVGWWVVATFDTGCRLGSGSRIIDTGVEMAHINDVGGSRILQVEVSHCRQ